MIEYTWKGRDGLQLAARYARTVGAWALSIARPDEPVCRVEYWDTTTDVLRRVAALGAQVQL